MTAVAGQCVGPASLTVIRHSVRGLSGSISGAQVTDVPQGRVGADHHARRHESGQSFERLGDARQLGGIAGVRPHIQRHSLGIHGLQDTHLASDSAIGAPALAHQTGGLIGTGHA